MRAGRSCARPRDGRTARAIERVGGAGEPPGVITACQLQLRGRFDFEPRTQVRDIPPAYLVGEAVLVVRGGVQLIERSPCAISTIVITGGVVVFAEQPRLAFPRGEGAADQRVTGPCPDRVGTD